MKKFILFCLAAVLFYTPLVGAQLLTSPPPKKARKINNLCLKAAEQIRKDLTELSRQFPILNGIKSVNIETNDPVLKVDGKRFFNLVVHLKLEKNVAQEPNGVDANGVAAQAAYVSTVHKNGLILEVSIDSPRPLLSGEKLEISKDPPLLLAYEVESNPSDESLYTTVRNVLDKNVALLKTSLKKLKKDPGDDDKDDLDDDGHGDDKR